jgi:hypothetical protein
MTTFAFIQSHKLRVKGHQTSCWTVAEASDVNGRILPFEFSITDDGSGNFLLVYRSTDGSLYADTWHQTTEDAISFACEEFGISREDWTVS